MSLHSLDVGHVVDVLRSPRGLSQRNIDRLLQAAHNLVNKPVMIRSGQGSIPVWNVNVRHDTVDMQADLVTILGAPEDPDNRHLFDFAASQF